MRAPALVAHWPSAHLELAFMSVLPSLAKQARQRTAPPPVPPLVDKSEFENHEAYKAYMATRRTAQERLREFKRLPRIRSARVAQPSAASQELSKAIEQPAQARAPHLFACRRGDRSQKVTVGFLR